MIRTTFVAVIVIFLACCSTHSPNQVEATQRKPILIRLDNVNDPAVQTEFITAFASNPACKGVVLHYNPTNPLTGQWIPLKDGEQQLIVSSMLGEQPRGTATWFLGSMHGDGTPKEIATQVCRILKGAGGAVN